jgi:hypothetical protein
MNTKTSVLLVILYSWIEPLCAHTEWGASHEQFKMTRRSLPGEEEAVSLLALGRRRECLTLKSTVLMFMHMTVADDFL